MKWTLPGVPDNHAFPSPACLAAANVEELRMEARLGYRAPYIHELAQAVASGAIDLEGFKDTDLPIPDLRKRLLALKGVGSYAAANLLMLLGRYDYLPVDSWALKLVSHEWHGGEPVGPADVETAFEHWGPLEGPGLLVLGLVVHRVILPAPRFWSTMTASLRFGGKARRAYGQEWCARIGDGHHRPPRRRRVHRSRNCGRMGARRLPGDLRRLHRWQRRLPRAGHDPREAG